MKRHVTTSVLFDIPGPKARARTRIFNIVSLVLIAALLLYIGVVMHRQGQLEAEKWTSLFSGNLWANYLLPGLFNTLKAALIAVITSVAFGIFFGMARLSPLAPVRWFGTVVVEFFRAVPVLIMMIFFWLFLGQFSIFSPSQLPFIAVVLGLTLYNGSVIAELLRSGVHQLPKGQGEAGLAIGLTPWKVLTSVLVPQAMTAMMPSLLSQFVVILKDTALGYIISYPELLASARRFGSGEGNILQMLLLAALIFIVINFALTLLAEYLSKFMSSRSDVAIKHADGVPGEVDDARPKTEMMFKIPKA
ncbi:MULTISPECIES: amino acid ABC transporter permease [unclassified Rothia (in: high G+C Gram-positive bacteria)]|uniref:amino acid ABC transporter permease n=1 Tax=unclassified Rothia (in: high G+C Gram-positive bacteria) TaxID=2689056 RepID=UPI00195A2E9E|nr:MULTISPECIES: amino acid ABC transporter permease [unclassified Rothia (in: high G+C Gram-positive bacteria)]MBM7051104.1 amino acid ABC transporter permease [Rothia sp. ZJ1223]QRZ62195.1 amino acid ABC transporter permease [Rothia sp. ZJ932]